MTNQPDINKSKAQHISMSKFTLRIKQLFLNFLLYLINDFEDFFKKDSKYGTPLKITETSTTQASEKDWDKESMKHATVH